MKNTLLFLVLAMSTQVAMAKSNLKKSQLAKIVSINETKSLRVYLNKRLTTYWSEVAGSSTGAPNGNYTERVEKNLLKVIVGRNVKGLITYVSPNKNKVKVSFDNDCYEPSCSYAFELSDGVYDLISVPRQRQGYELVAAKSGVIFRGNPLDKRRIHLKIKKKELYKINRETQRPQGHN